MKDNSCVTSNGKFSYITEEGYVRNIFSIIFALKKADVPYTDHKMFDGWQITFPWCEGDVICHFGSYGSDGGYVESMNFPWDEGDVSTDTPEEMAKKIIDYYKELNK